MFSSTSLFAEIDCPLYREGKCERPYCKYSHDVTDTTDLGDVRVTFAPPTEEENVLCVRELERLNKEIEAVKSEVEKEQKKLSQFQAESASHRSRKTSMPSKDHNGNHLKLTRANSSSNPKYVVDRVRPKTDLEYDPCSNFSADLLFGSSAESTMKSSEKINADHDLGKTRSLLQQSYCVDSDDEDDGTLIIDMDNGVKNGSRGGKTFALEEQDQNAKELEISRENAARSLTLAQEQESSEGELIIVSACEDEHREVVRGTTEVSPSSGLHHGFGPSENDNDPSGLLRVVEDSPYSVSTMEEAKKAPSMDNIFDDISISLHQLRSESESLRRNGGVAPPVRRKADLSCSETEDFSTSRPETVSTSPAFKHTQPHEVFSTPRPETVSPSPAFKHTQAHEVFSTPRQETVSPSPAFTHTQPHHLFSSKPSQLNLPSETVAATTSGQKVRTALEYQHGPPSSSVSFILPTLDSASMDGNNSEAQDLDSSSDADLRYSELELSETDPVEECYRIFMEANQNEAQCNADQGTSEPQGTETLSNPTVVKKRVAHVAKFESTKITPKIILPLQEGCAQFLLPDQSRPFQRTAAILKSAAPRKILTTTITHPSVVQQPHHLIQMGANLHCTLIVPECGAALPLTLIPAAGVANPLSNHLLSIQRQPQPTLPAPPPPSVVNYTPAKSLGVKRKAKVRHEVGAKVPHDVRQRYVNLFVEEFLKSSVTVQDAFEKALAEEKTVYDRSVNKLKYLSIAVNALKRLKNQSITTPKAPSDGDHLASRGNVPLNAQALQCEEPGESALYEQLKEYLLSQDLLQANNYPRQPQEKSHVTLQYADVRKSSSNPLKICCRCGATFTIDKSGKNTRHEECNYHYGKVLENRVPGGVETRYSCCESAVGSPGCQVFNLHVHDTLSLHGTVSTRPPSHSSRTRPAVFAVDTQTCFTTEGLELARVTVVSSALQVVFDTFVKPDNVVIDYNTRFSGIVEDDVKRSTSSLQDVQASLLSFITADTILIGHGLENDLRALKMSHGSVIDTSVVFPHHLGLPHKRELNSLTADYLRRIIQESADGHDTREDAMACMELMLWRVKEDSKVKRMFV